MAGKLQKKKVRLAAGSKRGSSDTSSVSGMEGRDSAMSCELSDQPVADIILAVAEALCSIDEECKHTEDIDVLLKEARKGLEGGNDGGDQCSRVEETIHTSEVLVSDLLLTSYGKKSLKVSFCSWHF